jgi:hypothetical protein
MNDEAESSEAAQRRGDSSHELEDAEDAMTSVDEEERQRLKDQLAKERRLDAKRKRIRMLNELLRELDLMVYTQLITVYYLECDHPIAPAAHPN